MNLAIAIALAAEGFKNKTDKAGEPYILHCLRVMNNLHTKDKELQTIAILHDFVEDLYENNFEEGFKFLNQQGFSSRVIFALNLLTHIPSIDYMMYIRSLHHCDDARFVKLADLKDNSDITRLKGLTAKDFSRMEKYHMAYTYLSKI